MNAPLAIEALAGTDNWFAARPRTNSATVHIGTRAGMLVAIAASGRKKDGRLIFTCRCDCGATIERGSNAFMTAVRSGALSSCGCSPSQPNLKHGRRGTDEYRIWCAIRRRCFSPSHKDFAKYGAHGVTMGSAFAEDFSAFYAEVGDRPSKQHSIDRIDTRRGYEPGNIRWATTTEQAINRRSTYSWIVLGLPFDSSTVAARHFGVSVTTIFRWVNGFHDRRRGTYCPPRADCRRSPRYAD